MRLIRIIFPVFFMLVYHLHYGQDESFRPMNETQTVRSKIKENAKKTISVSSDFIQEKHLTMMDEVLVSQGRFLYKKENKVRWEYTEPVNYAIIVNGSTFTINNDGKISAFDAESNPLFREINQMIMIAISGDFVDNQDFIPGFFENESMVLVRLKPVNELLLDILESIEIYFSKPSLQVEMMKFIEPEGDFTRTVFTNREENTDIAEEKFHAE